MTFFLGLDLGQAADPTAIAVVERLLPPPPLPTPTPARSPSRAPVFSSRLYPIPSGPQPPPPYEFDCRHLERVPLNTPYPAVVDRVQELLATPALRNQTQLVVDATGVGRPVVDLFEHRGLDPVAITITGGDTVTYERGWRVPKRDLVGAVAVLLQSDRLRFAERLPEVPTLVRELLAFRVKIDPLTAHDSYGAWREGAHDDLVLALAVAVWHGLRWTPPRPRLASFSYYTG